MNQRKSSRSGGSSGRVSPSSLFLNTDTTMSELQARRRRQRHQRMQNERRRMKATTKTTQTDFSLLVDSNGNINPELAQRIFKWDQSQRLDQNLPLYSRGTSTRDGLRWVQEIANQVSATSTIPHNQMYEDLIQEGVIALMQAMKNFEADARPGQSYEQYVTERIRITLEDYVYVRSNYPRLRHDKPSASRNALSVESTVEIVDPVETHYSNQDDWETREGLLLNKGDTAAASPVTTRTASNNKRKKTKRNSDDYNDDDDELNNNNSIMEDELPLVEQFLDETLQYEGEDEMWIHQQQVAAPLRDSIPDKEDDASTIIMMMDELLAASSTASSSSSSSTGSTNSSESESLPKSKSLLTPDDHALRDMIRYNVDEFLGTTLNEIETKVIQMRFGLQPLIDEDNNGINTKRTTRSTSSAAAATTSTGTGTTIMMYDDAKSMTQVASILNLSTNQVRKIQKEALLKLRITYSKYYMDETHDEYNEYNEDEDEDGYDDDDDGYYYYDEDSV